MRHWCNLAAKESGPECACVSKDDFTVLGSGGGRPSSEHVYCVAIAFEMTEWAEQWICMKFCVMLEHSSAETMRMIQKAVAMGNWWLAALSRQCAHSCITPPAEFFFWWKKTYSPDLALCNFWLFPNLKSPLKGKRFQTFDEVQENWIGQLMAIGRSVWGLKVSTLKGTEASLSYVQCFLYLLQ